MIVIYSKVYLFVCILFIQMILDYLMNKCSGKKYDINKSIYTDKSSLPKLFLRLFFSSDKLVYISSFLMVLSIFFVFSYFELYLFSLFSFPLLYVFISLSSVINDKLKSPEIKLIYGDKLVIYNFSLFKVIEYEVDSFDNIKEENESILVFKIISTDGLSQEYSDITTVKVKVDDFNKREKIKSLFTISKI